MKSILSTSFFLFIFIGLIHAQTRTVRSLRKEYDLQGNIRRVIRTKVTTSKYPEPLNYYKRTVVDIDEYYANGQIKSRQRRIRKIGNSGRPYYEILSDEQFFNDQGIIQSRQTSKCDKRKIIYREYDPQGRLEYTSVAKPW